MRIGARSLIAMALIATWTSVLVFVTRGIVAQYFPLADEWALLAHSHPLFVDPAGWLSEGFSNYFGQFSELAQPTTNYLRPVFNSVYWLTGTALSPESGGYLYFNCLVIAASAGLVWLDASTPTGARTRTIALVTAAAVPLMPAFLPTLYLLFFPCTAFDPLAACLALLALLAYERGRILLTAVLLLAAIFTKEAALPVAVALPLIHLIQHRRQLRTTPSLRWSAIMLCAPVLIWLLLRFAVFDGVVGGTQAPPLSLIGSVKLALQLALRLPFWMNALPFRQPDPASILLLLANAMMMIAVFGILLTRLRRREWPQPVEVCWLACYGFLLLVGFAARLGAVMEVFLIVCLLRWHAEGLRPRLVVLAFAGLTLGVAVTGYQAWQRFPQTEATFRNQYEIGRQYVAALRKFQPGERVLVLNDPVTRYARLHWLLKTERLSAAATKIADTECDAVSDRLNQHCVVTLTPQAHARQFVFAQSCGLDVCGAHWPTETPLVFRPADDVQVELVPPQADEGDARAFRLALGQGDVSLLYYDPAIGDFSVLHVP